MPYTTRSGYLSDKGKQPFIPKLEQPYTSPEEPNERIAVTSSLEYKSRKQEQWKKCKRKMNIETFQGKCKIKKLKC